MCEDSMEHDDASYRVSVSAPGDLSEKDLAVCIAIIKDGEAVDPESATRGISRATAVALARQGNTIVGVGAIKRARPHYASSVAGPEKDRKSTRLNSSHTVI